MVSKPQKKYKRLSSYLFRVQKKSYVYRGNIVLGHC